MGKIIDIAGKKYNRLTVVNYSHSKNGISYWLCRCDCGKEKIIRGSSLADGNTKSCGCLQTEVQSKRNTKHSLFGTRLYTIWALIKNRCYNPNNPEYKNYGGRGIKMCSEWFDDRNNVINFNNWAINNGYKEEILPNGNNKWTLDRINVNGNYEPSNCRFITNKEQCWNKRNNIIVKDGMCLAEYCEKNNLYYPTIHTRIYKLHWDIEKAITTKIRIRRK